MRRSNHSPRPHCGRIQVTNSQALIGVAPSRPTAHRATDQSRSASHVAEHAVRKVPCPSPRRARCRPLRWASPAAPARAARPGFPAAQSGPAGPPRANSAWLSLDTSLRAAFPRATRCSRVGWSGSPVGRAAASGCCFLRRRPRHRSFAPQSRWGSSAPDRACRISRAPRSTASAWTAAVSNQAASIVSCRSGTGVPRTAQACRDTTNC